MEETTNYHPALKQSPIAANNGGGQMVVPAGTFTTSSLRLRSNIELNLSVGATLQFVDNPDAYPVVESRWEGASRPVYASEISFSAIEITMASEPTPAAPDMMAGLEEMTAEGFYLGFAEKVSFDRVRVTGNRGAAYRLENTSDISWRACESSANEAAVVWKGKNSLSGL